MAQVFHLERRLVRVRDGQVPHPRREGLPSWTAREASPAGRLERVREHSQIETGLPARREDPLKEDRGCLRLGHAPPARAVLNHLVWGLLHRQGWRNAAEARRRDGKPLNPSAQLLFQRL